MSSDGKNPVYRYKNIDFEKIEVSKLNESAVQPLSYINYLDAKFGKTKVLIQTGKIKMTSGGVPPIHAQFWPTDDKRKFINVPLDPAQDACVELRKHIEKVEAYFGSNEMRKQIFGSREKQYQFSPCINIKAVADNNEADDGKKKFPKHDSVKMMLNTVKEGETDIVNLTKVIQLRDGKKTQIEAKKVQVVADNTCLNSEIRLLFTYNKLWANKMADRNTKMKMYGIGFKIMVVETTPGQGKGPDLSQCDFIPDDSSEEGDDAQTPEDGSDAGSPKKKDRKGSEDGSDAGTPKKSKKDRKKASEESDDGSKKSKKDRKKASEESDDGSKKSKKDRKKTSEESDDGSKKSKKDRKDKSETVSTKKSKK